ncbi:unnamed product [Ostreococcus tauri]|uniref:Unnamed product n=1 Tax=Ostreococcus tauri TaxID=70448 RepID=A0A090MA91_OSTTA|nr:unnamed product [Ostreococcus tauri]CEF99647.1 unnamed product [Ostreococcus tauri]|eukprot:XP_003082004.2 unnamed product [Ostreococcus tauri]
MASARARAARALAAASIAARASGAEASWARASAHGTMRTTAAWSVEETTTTRASTRARANEGETMRAIALAGLEAPSDADERAVFVRDVEEILEMCARLDEAEEAETAEAMWTTRETNAVTGEGLRMRFDASARVGAGTGETELASVDRGRLLREAKYSAGEFYVSPGKAKSEE